MKFAERVLQELGSTTVECVCLRTGLKSKGGRQGSSGREAGKLTLTVATAGCLLAVSDLYLFSAFPSPQHRHSSLPQRNAHTARLEAHAFKHTDVCGYTNTHMHYTVCTDISTFKVS